MTEAGRYPQTILGTCCVPWHVDGTVDEQRFRRSISTLVRLGLRDLYVFGTAGEGYAVSERQFDEVTRVFVDALEEHELSPMVGIISLSTSTVIERIERCSQLGVRLFQVSLPSWGALSDHELRRFFEETCGRFPELQFLHYNLPRAGRVLTPKEYAELADRYLNLVATKNAGASPEVAEALLAEAGALRHFFTELGYAHASLHGEPGLLISIASMHPGIAREFFDAGRAGDVAGLSALAREVTGVGEELAAALGSDLIDGAYDKCFSRIHDRQFPLDLLPPYDGATPEQFERFTKRVADRYPRWLELMDVCRSCGAPATQEEAAVGSGRDPVSVRGSSDRQ